MTEISLTPEEKIEETLPASKKAVLAIQHVFIMNAYVVPVIVASIIGFTSEQSSSLIQATLLASGIATLLQAKFFMKYPVVYGASFVPIGAIVGIYFLNGGTIEAWSYVVGACFAGAIALTLLGLSKRFKAVLDRLVTPVVSATIVLCIGLALIPLAFSSMIASDDPNIFGNNLLIAFVTMATMVVFSMLGLKPGKFGTISRIGSGIFALIAGFITAGLLGPIDMIPVHNASWLARPALPFIDYGVKFDFMSVLTMIVLYFIMMTETTGTWFVTSSATDTELTEERVNKGVIGLGISNAIGSLLGATPQTGYSSNVGILTITDIFSRHVFTYVGILLIVIGCSAKLTSLIAVIPGAAVGGIFLLTSGIIAAAGVGMFKNIEIGLKETYIIAISSIVAIALNIVPAGAFEFLPVLVQYILGSSIATSALVAILLNKIIPDAK